MGAGAGIGKATAHRLVKEGAHVVCVDRDEAGAEATAQEIIDTYGEGIGVAGTRPQQLRPGDRPRPATSPTATASRAMFEDVLLAYGGLDAVVVTAGIFVPPDRNGRVDDRQWALTFAINVTGAYIVADEANKICQAPGAARRASC